MLTVFSVQPVIPLLKSFWLDNFQRRTCFFDLRRVVAGMRTDKVKEFHNFISENARSRTPDTPSEVRSLKKKTNMLHLAHMIDSQPQGNGYLPKPVSYSLSILYSSP